MFCLPQETFDTLETKGPLGSSKKNIDVSRPLVVVYLSPELRIVQKVTGIG